MKLMSKSTVIAMAIVIIAALLTGCSASAEGDTEKHSEALSLIVGNHLCSRELNLNSPTILNAVSETIASYGFISVVSVDGSPSLLAADSYDIPEQYKKASKEKLKADAENKARELMMQVSEVKADDREVDTLEAIRIAVRSFASVPETANKTLIIVDTGWSTTGLVNFENNILGADPQAIADMLAEKEAIPDLSNITIIWQQMGDVAEPQQELSPKQRITLENIWKAIIERGGGTFECSPEVPNNDVIGGSLPEVSAIKLPEEEPVKFDAETMTVSDTLFSEPVFFTEEQIQFKGDSDAYVDPGKAKNCIEPIAEYMNAKPDFTILLIGTTAGDTDSQYVRDLSYARANAVKNSLVGMGVSETRIVVVGLGNCDPWHIYGVGTSGELAAQNRKVVMISTDDEMAGKILSEYERG